jgi:hypothetical protein
MGPSSDEKDIAHIYMQSYGNPDNPSLVSWHARPGDLPVMRCRLADLARS